MADHKEYWSTESDQGSIRISEDVVASIAALSASETKGDSGLYSSLTSDIVGFTVKRICPRASVSNSATMIPLR